MMTMLALVTGTVRYSRHALGKGMTLVCPHGRARLEFAVMLSANKRILSGPAHVTRRRAARMLAKAWRDRRLTH